MKQWLFIHGNGGSVADPEQTGSMKTGGGWRVTLYSHNENWAHFTVPTFSKDNWKVDRINLSLFIAGSGRISKIELWDWHTNFWNKDVNFTGTHNGKEYDKDLDLGRKWSIHRGLGISISLVYPVNIDILAKIPPLFLFRAVGARFTK